MVVKKEKEKDPLTIKVDSVVNSVIEESRRYYPEAEKFDKKIEDIKKELFYILESMRVDQYVAGWNRHKEWLEEETKDGFVDNLKIEEIRKKELGII